MALKPVMHVEDGKVYTGGNVSGDGEEDNYKLADWERIDNNYVITNYTSTSQLWEAPSDGYLMIEFYNNSTDPVNAAISIPNANGSAYAITNIWGNTSGNHYNVGTYVRKGCKYVLSVASAVKNNSRYGAYFSTMSKND